MINQNELCVGERVLIQKTSSVREVATIKAIEKGQVIVRLSDGKFTEIDPNRIIKSFGIL